MYPSPAFVEPEVQMRLARAEVHKMLAAAKIDFSAVTLLLNSGNLTSRILETESKERIDLLVMGSHGRRGFARLVMGSHTESMIHASTCPVLVVTSATEGFFDPELGKGFKSVLLATDFSPCSDRALAVALKWAHEFSGRLTLFHCVEQIPNETKGMTDIFPEYNPYFEKQLARGWEQIEHLVPASERQGLEVVCEVRHGNPKGEIVRVAREKCADLIVTGAQCADKMGAPWGSVSSTIARNGSIPVLVVRSLGYSPKQ
jgi:nucleotide-binding universal stress UspA family protein